MNNSINFAYKLTLEVIPISLIAYTRESRTTILPKLQIAIVTNGCYVTDFTIFSPTEISISIEGEAGSAINALKAIDNLGITFSENPDFELRFIDKGNREVNLIIYLVTGKKKDLGNFLDERIGK